MGFASTINKENKHLINRTNQHIIRLDEMVKNPLWKHLKLILLLSQFRKERGRKIINFNS